MYIQANLLDETFKWCLNDKEVLSIVCENLSAKDIPKKLKSYDTVLSIIKQEYRKSGNTLTLGEVEQKYYQRGFEEDLIFERIRKAPLSNREGLFGELTKHVKSVKAIQAYEDFGDSYQGKERDKLEALDNFIAGIKEVEEVDFEPAEVVSYSPFIDLTSMISEAEVKTETGNNVKMPLYIPFLDEAIQGGVDETDTTLFILPSGGGKSTLLKTIGVNCARNGFRGIHFQLEGASDEAVFKYGSIFSGLSYHDQKRGYIPYKKLVRPRTILHNGELITLETFEDAIRYNEIQMETRRRLNHEFDLTLIPFEIMGSPYVDKVIKEIDTWVEINGRNPDFIMIDSIDLLYPNDGNSYTGDAAGIKARLQAVSKALKNIATIYSTRVFAVTQTSDIPIEKWNDPNFVITRNHVMGDKNMVNPFSYVFSGNRTMQEKKKGIARIFMDKLRHSGDSHPVIFVKTSFDIGKYIDIKGTKDKFNKLNSPDYVPPIDDEKENKSETDSN